MVKWNQKTHAFSLIELSVVLVIIGLIVGAIIGGDALVHNSKLRNVISEINQYQRVVTSFRERFRAYPGDYDQAVDMWGDDTEDGDANWLIEGDIAESIYAWQHLNLAHMIEGSYTGKTAGTPAIQAGVNVPRSVFVANHYMIGSAASDEAIFDRSGSYIQYTSNTSGGSAWGPSLVPKDALYIDKKIDDGLADDGDLYGVDGIGVVDGQCSAQASTIGDAYNKRPDAKTCRLVRWID